MNLDALWRELHAGQAASAAAGGPRTSGPPAASSDTRGREVSRVVSDSREAVPGSVFVALRGAHADGTAFAREALARGSVAIVSEAPRPPDIAVPWLQVADARRAVAVLAAAFERRPSEE